MKKLNQSRARYYRRLSGYEAGVASGKARRLGEPAGTIFVVAGAVEPSGVGVVCRPVMARFRIMNTDGLGSLRVANGAVGEAGIG